MKSNIILYIWKQHSGIEVFYSILFCPLINTLLLTDFNIKV